VKKILIGAGVLLLAVAVFYGSVGAASESGEIVVLTSYGDDGEPVETRLWVIEDGGHQWLRAGMPSSGWLLRLEARPEVLVERTGATGRYRAVPVREPAVRDRVHALMAEKYGFADRWISMIRDGTQSVAVRLEPLAPGS
jgi:hypothetical protein